MLTYELDMLRAELATVRAERDAARREVLTWLGERCSRTEMTQEIKERGWDYLKATAAPVTVPAERTADGFCQLDRKQLEINNLMSEVSKLQNQVDDYRECFGALARERDELWADLERVTALPLTDYEYFKTFDPGMPPTAAVTHTLTGVLHRVPAPPPPFVGDDDHGDTPVPEYARCAAATDALAQVNEVLAHDYGLNAHTVRALTLARHEINALRTRLYNIRLGHEGCCHTCEPVGAENRSVLAERDAARREICATAVSSDPRWRNYSHEQACREYARTRGWDLSTEFGK